jgi:uncharacterized protein YqeY
MGFADTIGNDLKTAMKTGDKIALEVLRMLKSEFKYKEIELGRDLNDEDYLSALSSAAKRRREAINEFKKGGRDDLANKESAELNIINKYLPQQLSNAEIEKVVDEVIAEVEATTPADIGKVMKAVMPRVKGRADGRKINEIVGKKLNS